MKHVIELNVDTTEACKEVENFGAHFKASIEKNMAELAGLQASMQKLTKRPWYSAIHPVQWVILGLLVADIILHAIK
jgi:hypothetical protein